MSSRLFRTHLQTFVQLRILELRAMPAGRRAIQCDWDIAQARAESYLGGAGDGVLAARVDLLFGSPQIGAPRTRKDFEDSAHMMRLLTNQLAATAMSCPGGVTVFGMHWCRDHEECLDAEEQARARVEETRTVAEPTDSERDAPCVTYSERLFDSLDDFGRPDRDAD